jgi:hypothetical protein
MPGAGNPLLPAQRIDCEMETGRTGYLDGNGRENSRITSSVAVAGVEIPDGEAWLCYDSPTPADCRNAANCEYFGELLISKCSPVRWALSENGIYFIACGVVQEQDVDGDGQFTIVFDNRASHVALLR